ncbi:MAG: LEA type 2 family protein [Gemmatimonadaceae bacterium]|nr:LEA type 2 family protein [Gemmatimonadaceae bacterium]
MQVPEIRRRAVCLAVVLAAAVSGCATAARAIFTQPDVGFRGVGVRSIGLDGADLEVLLNIYNPNGYSLGASQLQYRLLVDSVEIGSGAIDSGFSVKERDSMVVRLPVRVGFRALQTVGPRLLRGGEIPYRLMGAVSLKSFAGTFSRQFNEAGRFDAARTFRP